MKAVEPIQRVNILQHLLKDDGQFPNNALLPLLVYQQVLPPEEQHAENVKKLFEENDWTDSWEDGVYDYHHYHSTAHEVLGVIRGSARIEFGGPKGVSLLLEKGDVVIIPAGVAHKAIDVYDDFTVIGAYPLGQKYDMNYGNPEEREKAIENIKSVPLPLTDPVYGAEEGPLLKNWSVM